MAKSYAQVRAGFLVQRADERAGRRGWPSHLRFISKEGLSLDESKSLGGSQEENTISEVTEGNCSQELRNERT